MTAKKKKDPVAEYIKRITSRGGKARARKLSPEERREIARRAALARWRKRKPSP